MARFDLYDSDPSIVIERDDVEGNVMLRIGTTDGNVVLNVGGSYDDAEALVSSLRDAADNARALIIDTWEDIPAEWDGYVGYDRGAYRASLSGKSLGDRYGFPTGDIAIYHVAEAMAEAGEFRNAWFEGEHGPTQRMINDEVRAFHDDGGDKMKPLDGVQYAEGDLVEADAGWPMRVERDYGQLGVVLYADGDPSVREHVTDRAILHKLEEED